MAMLCLFCNDGYGQPFEAEARAFTREQGIPLLVVHSGRRGEALAGRRSPASRLKWQLQCFLRSILLSAKEGGPTWLVSDVNARFFSCQLGGQMHGVIAGFNQIFQPATINRLASLVNFHPSVLPYYRGPVPSYWCLENKEERTGYTLHRVTGEIDRGEPLFQEELAIGSARTDRDLDLLIAARAASCFRRYLAHLFLGKPFDRVLLEAGQIYRVRLDYGSFPPAPR